MTTDVVENSKGGAPQGSFVGFFNLNIASTQKYKDTSQGTQKQSRWDS